MYKIKHGLRLYKGVEFAALDDANIDFPGVDSSRILGSIENFLQPYLYKRYEQTTFIKSNKDSIVVKLSADKARRINYISFDNEISESGVTFAKVIDRIKNNEEETILEFSTDIWLTFCVERTSPNWHLKGNLVRSHLNSLKVEDYEVASYSRKGNWSKNIIANVQAEQFKQNEQIKDMDIIVLTTKIDIIYNKKTRQSTQIEQKSGLLSPLNHYLFLYDRKRNKFMTKIKLGEGDAFSAEYHDFKEVINILQSDENWVNSIVDLTVYPYMSFLMKKGTGDEIRLFNPKKSTNILHTVVNPLSVYSVFNSMPGWFGLSGIRIPKLAGDYGIDFTWTIAWGGAEYKQSWERDLKDGSYKTKTIFNDSLDNFDKRYRQFMVDGFPNKLLCAPYNTIVISNSKGESITIDPAFLPVNKNGVPYLILELATVIGTTPSYMLHVVDYKKDYKTERVSARSYADPLQEMVNVPIKRGNTIVDMEKDLSDRVDFTNVLISEYNIKIPTVIDEMASYIQSSKNSVAYSQKAADENRIIGAISQGASGLSGGLLNGILAGASGLATGIVASKQQKQAEEMKKSDLRNLMPSVNGGQTSDNAHFQFSSGLLKMEHFRTEESYMQQINSYHNNYGYSNSLAVNLTGDKFYKITKYINSDLTKRDFTYVQFSGVEIINTTIPHVYLELFEDLYEKGITLYNATDKDINYFDNSKSIMNLHIDNVYIEDEIENTVINDSIYIEEVQNELKDFNKIIDDIEVKEVINDEKQ